MPNSTLCYSTWTSGIHHVHCLLALNFRRLSHVMLFRKACDLTKKIRAPIIRECIYGCSLLFSCSSHSYKQLIFKSNFYAMYIRIYVIIKLSIRRLTSGTCIILWSRESPLRHSRTAARMTNDIDKKISWIAKHEGVNKWWCLNL